MTPEEFSRNRNVSPEFMRAFEPPRWTVIVFLPVRLAAALYRAWLRVRHRAA